MSVRDDQDQKSAKNYNILLQALKDIWNATNENDPDSYCNDDRSGALTYTFEVADEALEKIKL